jgi:hypothetical protein
MNDEATPRRPDLPTGVNRLTIVGLILAITGTVMAIPFLILGNSYYGFPGDEPPSGWQSGLWSLAFVVGTPSLILGIVQHRRAKRRGDRRGRRWANLLIGIAFTGALIWLAGMRGNGHRSLIQRPKVMARLHHGVFFVDESRRSLSGEA